LARTTLDTINRLKSIFLQVIPPQAHAGIKTAQRFTAISRGYALSGEIVDAFDFSVPMALNTPMPVWT
jgi:hypothetical protein